jgi:hypothetical protein
MRSTLGKEISVEEILKHLHKTVRVDVSWEPPQTKNSTHVYVGKVIAIQYNLVDAHGGRPGEGVLLFEGGLTCHWGQYNTVRIADLS